MTDAEVNLNIVEIRKPDIDAQLVAAGIADQLERRIAFRRAMKRAVQSALRGGALGIRINCSGRLGGAEIAKAACRCIPCAPISITAQPRRRRRWAIAASKSGSSAVKFWSMIRWRTKSAPPKVSRNVHKI
jgi:ribosomal protein S3